MNRTSLLRLEEDSKDFRDEWETLNVDYGQAVSLARVNRESSPVLAKRFSVRDSPAVFLIINNKVSMPGLGPVPYVRHRTACCSTNLREICPV